MRQKELLCIEGRGSDVQPMHIQYTSKRQIWCPDV
jgi:hypothetical protein